MTWALTLEKRVDYLEQDIARIERALARVPHNVVDWSAYWARIDRLRCDAMRLKADLRAATEKLAREALT